MDPVDPILVGGVAKSELGEEEDATAAFGPQSVTEEPAGTMSGSRGMPSGRQVQACLPSLAGGLVPFIYLESCGKGHVGLLILAASQEGHAESRLGLGIVLPFC